MPSCTHWLSRAAAAGLLALPAAASAHHSFAATFDGDKVIEMEGEVTAVRWRNPHVSFDLRVVGEDGQTRIWNVETLAIAGLRRRDIVSSFVSVGDHVRIAGNPARRGGHDLYLGNIQLPNGKEIVLQSNKTPRFSKELLGTTGATFATEGDASRPELGIFRVWSTPSASPFPFPEDANPALALKNFPLTESARAAVESFDPATDDPLLNCADKGMPTIMEQPYPIQFTKTDDGDILLHLEEYDTVRRIHMDSDTDSAEQPATLLGFSQGRWEGRTLVVETTRLGWGHYDTVGIPLNEDARLVERFELAEDGSRLDWTMRITDPTTFTEPVTLSKFFFYVPGVQVERFECNDEGL